MKTNSISNGPVSGQAFTHGLRMVVIASLLFLSLVTFAQTKTQSGATELYDVKGVVIASKDNTPLAGVNIYLKGTSVGTFSDADGKFTFPRSLAAGEVLVFSFVGLMKQELVVTASLPDSVEIKLEEDPINILGEVWMEKPETNKQKRRSSGN